MTVDKKCKTETCLDGLHENFSFIKKDCRCDKFCKFYNDCCHKPKKETLLLKNVSCITDERFSFPDSYNYLYMIDACPVQFTNQSNPEMDVYRSKCEAEGMPTENKNWGTRYLLPVSGRITVKKKRMITVVFRNIYCAVCNSATELKSWSVIQECKLEGRISKGIPFSNLYNTLLTESFSKTRCNLHLQPPDNDLIRSGVRYCKRAFSHTSCLSSTNTRDIKMCLSAPSRNVYVDSGGHFTAFRNEYCARCHGLNLTYVTCDDPRRVPVNKKTTQSFNFRFSINWLQSMGSIEYFENSNNYDRPTLKKSGKLITCPNNKVYDPFDRSCHSVCPENRYTSIKGDWDTVKCSETPIEKTQKSNDEPFESTVKLTTIRPTSSTSLDRWTTLEVIKKTPKPARREVPVEKESLCPPDKRLVLVKNDSKGDSIVRGYRVMREKGTGRYYICSKQEIGKGHSVAPVHAYTFDFDRNLYVVSLVATSMSIIGLTILLGVYFILSKLRDLEGKCLISLCSVLFVAQFLLLVGTKRTEVRYVCLTIATILHYSFLVVFFWTNCLLVDSIRLLKSRSQNNEEGRRFVLYSLYSWILPLFITVTALLLDISTNYDYYRPNYALNECWITSRKGLLIWFVLPSSYCLLIDLFLLLRAICIVCSRPVERGRRTLTVYALFLLLLGSSWISAFCWAFSNRQILAYTFVLTNGSQGVFLCLSVVCAQRVFVGLVNKGRICETYEQTDRFPISHRTRQYIYDESKISTHETRI